MVRTLEDANGERTSGVAPCLNLYEDTDQDTRCGVGPCQKLPALQRLATKNVLIVAYGVLGCLCFSTYSYYNSTISTIEKRFHISSEYSGKLSSKHFCLRFKPAMSPPKQQINLIADKWQI